MTTTTRFLLITANVGTIFEKIDEFLVSWLDELAESIKELNPDFIALHMQETGGKNYCFTMQTIDPFFKKFLAHPVMQRFNRYLILADTDFTDDSNFTSLCNVYLISENVPANSIQLYNFKEKSFENFTHRKIYTGNLKDNAYLVKERFEKDFFKMLQWSRKGFLQTKWKIRDKTLDFVNIHLFHDPSNLIALTKSPSIYSESRLRALEYSIRKIESNGLPNEPVNYSVFGDFNFRLDLAKLVHNYSKIENAIETKNGDEEIIKLICKDHSNNEIFTIEPKTFLWHSVESIQSEKLNLMKFDNELSFCSIPMFELDKTFPPSYPFSEDSNDVSTYSDTRCPAWCDRILLNKTLYNNVVSHSNKDSVAYGMLGEDKFMGDHKPIYLRFDLIYDEQTKKNDPVMPPATTNNATILVNNRPSNFDSTSLGNMNDIHDFALFNNVSKLSQFKTFSTYYNYTVKEKDFAYNSNSNGATSSNNEYDLGALVEKVAQLFAKKLSQMELNEINNNNVEFESLLRESGDKQNPLLDLFLDKLNGNFFKWKHLLGTLKDVNDELMTLVAKQVATSSPSTSSSTELSNYLNKLNEVYHLLSSAFINDLYKRALTAK